MNIRDRLSNANHAESGSITNRGERSLVVVVVLREERVQPTDARVFGAVGEEVHELRPQPFPPGRPHQSQQEPRAVRAEPQVVGLPFFVPLEQLDDGLLPLLDGQRFKGLSRERNTVSVD